MVGRRIFEVRLQKRWRTVQKVTQRHFASIRRLQRKSFSVNEIIFLIGWKRQELKSMTTGLRR